VSEPRVSERLFGTTLTQRSSELAAVEPVRGSRLAALVPAIAGAGWVVEAITAIQLGEDAGLRAVVLRKAAEPRSGAEDEAPSPDEREACLGIARCDSERGYDLAAPPYSLGNGASLEVLSVERLSVAGRPVETALTVVERSSIGEGVVPVLVLGAGDAASGGIRPAGATVGVVAELGYVAQWFHTTAEPDEATGDPGGPRTVVAERVEGTGLYPLAPNASAYVALRLEGGAVTGRIVGLAGARGFDHPFASSEPALDRPSTFALVGRGALPPRCADAAVSKSVRCERLAARSATLPYAWIAGLAPTMDAALSLASKLGVEPAQVDVLALDWQDEALPESSSGKKGIAAFRASR